MARNGVRAKLATAITQAYETGATVSVDGGPLRRDGVAQAFRIEARPVQVAGETLLLVCFLDAPTRTPHARKAAAPEDSLRIADLEAELDAARAELQSAVRSLEIAGEEQTTINEEALSVNEEYQSTNEELLTSKEELQSLNEELSALNSQLQETLDRQRTTANDLQNILYSTDVATVFLGADLSIRFFTPATRALFNILPSDLGRPLADLRALAPDAELLAEARAVLDDVAPADREIETADGVWYLRRLMPYRARGGAVEGVVITYTDVTERRQIARRLQAATAAADGANRAKSRFLAAASHDLRQPLQTLTLIQGLLERRVRDEAERKLITLQQQCLTAMSGMLNTLLDINQIDAGVVRATTADFSVNTLFDKLGAEFTHAATAKGLRLRIAPCSLTIHSDPALLEQMIRNLLANAIKYTARGKVLLGCRRRPGSVRIQVLDTGLGIPASHLELIFEEYHQIENEARERSQGLGLGLSIVKRLAELLGHQVGVQSLPHRGSVFSVDVARPAGEGAVPGVRPAVRIDPAPLVMPPAQKTGAILVVEDDPEVREMLRLVLEDEGHAVMTAVDGAGALAFVDKGRIHPDVTLADYNLPGGMTGLDFAGRLRARLGEDSPVVVLTGDISAETLRGIDLRGCVPLHKPVQPDILSQVIQRLLREAPPPALAPPPAFAAPAPAAPPAVSPPARAGAPTIFVVDDDADVREAIGLVLAAEGLACRAHADSEAFLADFHPGETGCLLIDAYLPGGMDGLDLLASLHAMGDPLPAIMITGEADVRIAVQAMKAGAADFIEKPIGREELLASIERALDQARDAGKRLAWQADAANRIAHLTPRQREIMALVVAGHPSKNIAADLGISQRTVENHRASIMKKTGSASLPALARLALAAA
jgi:two-component system CheB/CheR fusion protein